MERFDYKEAGPQLLLQAFLQRIVNGGGRIEREYGLGRGRTDLLVVWPWKGGIQRSVIELKLLRGDPARVIARGVEQTLAYQDHSGAGEAHLVIFDRDPAKPWQEKDLPPRRGWPSGGCDGGRRLLSTGRIPDPGIVHALRLLGGESPCARFT